jgi:hypothetical protein
MTAKNYLPMEEKPPKAIGQGVIASLFQVFAAYSFLPSCSFQEFLSLLAPCLASNPTTRLVVGILCRPVTPSSTTSFHKNTLVLSMISSPPTHPLIVIHLTLTTGPTAPITAANTSVSPNATNNATVQTTLTHPFIVTQLTAADAPTAAIATNNGITLPIDTSNVTVGCILTACQFLAIYFATANATTAAADALTVQVCSSISTAEKTITDHLVIVIPFTTTKATTVDVAATYTTTGHKYTYLNCTADNVTTALLFIVTCFHATGFSPAIGQGKKWYLQC